MSEDTKNLWKEIYTVDYAPDPLNPGLRIAFQCELKLHDGTVVGRYRGMGYAVKQARRKYKKYIRLMEKQLQIR